VLITYAEIAEMISVDMLGSMRDEISRSISIGQENRINLCSFDQGRES
jgi:hypothetical protein